MGHNQVVQEYLFLHITNQGDASVESEIEFENRHWWQIFNFNIILFCVACLSVVIIVLLVFKIWSNKLGYVTHLPL